MPFAPHHYRIRCAVFLAAASFASAQQVSTLHGTVRDPLGAVVPNATVELLDNQHVVQTTRATRLGEYAFTLPASGRYSVRVSAPTFQPTATPAEYLSTSVRTELNVTVATPTLTQQVTVTATGTPTPEAQTGAAVTVLSAESYRFTLEVQDPLRLIPGAQVTQVGEIGGTTGLNIRGASTDANKVLIDGVPANSIGGAVEFANIASVGIASIELLREPNSALYGSDALAGVVNLTTPRGGTRLPYLTYAGDAGNFHGYNNQVTAGTTYHQFDLYSAFARFDTDNNIPNSEFHNATYAGNFGWTPNPANDLRFTVRHLVVSGGQPNAINLYGIPDDGLEQEHDDYYNAAWNNQTTPRWHNQIRYGGLRQNGLFTEFGATGILDSDPNSFLYGEYLGAPVTITGANGYTVSGQAQFQYSSSLSTSNSTTRRDFVYAQTDYQVTPHLLVLGGFKYENESGTSVSAGSGYTTANAIQRGNYSYTIQLAGDLRNRLFYTLGSGLEDNGLYGFAGTPRASLVYYLVRPGGSGFFSGTKLHGTFGKGIKEPSVYDQDNSLVNLLSPLAGAPGVPSGAQVISQYNLTQIGAENSRTFDGGVDQQFFAGRSRLGVTYFHDEFTNGVEYVPTGGILQLFGIGASSPAATQIENLFGGYLNSFAFRSQGVEVESETKLVRNVFARAGYTYTDAVVQHSFSTDTSAPASIPRPASATSRSARTRRWWARAPSASRRTPATSPSSTHRIASTHRSMAPWWAAATTATSSATATQTPTAAPACSCRTATSTARISGLTLRRRLSARRRACSIYTDYGESAERALL